MKPLTTFPSFLDALTTTLLEDQSQRENPHHRALLNAYTEVQTLDQQLVGWATHHPRDDASATDQLDRLIDLLVERLAAGAELTRLLSAECCCADGAGKDRSSEDELRACPDDCCRPRTIVNAALRVFAAVGNPAAMASADLVACLRDLPGVTEGRRTYAELTQTALAQLLAPYGVSTQNVTLPDGRRLKSYRRAALLAALPF